MDKKVSDLPIKNTPDGTEYIHILDVNDLSDSPQGTDKRTPIQLSSNKQNLSEKGQPLGYAPLTYESRIPTSASPNINFEEINATFNPVLNNAIENTYWFKNTRTFTLPNTAFDYNFNGITAVGVTLTLALASGLTLAQGSLTAITANKIFSVFKRGTQILILGV